MIPDPLHPALVHLPLGLAVFAPLLAIVAWISIQQRLVPGRAWALVLLVQALLAGSAWLALEAGEREEDRAERVVAERHIEAHEEAAERFLLVAALGIPIAALGLLRGQAATVGRAVMVVASLATLAAAASAGRSGGELVYRHGASLAYLDAPDPAGGPRALMWTRSREEHEEDDDD